MRLFQISFPTPNMQIFAPAARISKPLVILKTLFSTNQNPAAIIHQSVTPHLQPTHYIHNCDFSSDIAAAWPSQRNGIMIPPRTCMTLKTQFLFIEQYTLDVWLRQERKCDAAATQRTDNIVSSSDIAATCRSEKNENVMLSPPKRPSAYIISFYRAV